MPSNESETLKARDQKKQDGQIQSTCHEVSDMQNVVQEDDRQAHRDIVQETAALALQSGIHKQTS
ncbi:Uncharacterised protein [Vibrio cholerae]|uniref:Uncharacterized protein n=1 Tax=Vibrio cholerae TaxID=666 RepID=A0A655YAZ3_VIBCL|nr:Uncharacterised protein [Vibrio cholerae]